MKKYSLSILLVILVLLTLISSAYAETADAEVSAAETENIIITSDLDLNDRETYQITNNTIVEEGVNVWFYGTELQIEPGVTLTILGSAEGDAVVAEGTLRVSGDSAYFRTGASFREEDSGKLEIDGHGYAELASNSTANNAYLDPDMNIEFTNEGSVTFGYFVPSEEYMRSLLSTLDNSNPNIRLDLQFYSGITLSDDLALPEHVTLHTDYNWGQGAGFTIPAGKTLTIPEAGGFYAFTSPIDIEGNLVNNGEVVLGSVRNVDYYPTIYNMTLSDGGSYSGNGNVSVETLENPLSYLSGFESYRMNETWRDESNNRITYQLIKTYNYRADDGLGEYTLPGSLTIKPGEQLLADTLIIPADATLTVNGSAYAYNALVINQGGALIIGDDARFELYNMQAPPTDTIINGTITLGNNAGLYMGLGHWTNSNIKNAITVTGQDALIQVDYHHSSSAPKTVNEMLGVITGDAAAVPSELEPYVSKLFSLCIPYEATADLVIPEGIQFRVLNNGSDETGSLTIPQGVGLTIPNGAHLVLAGANLTVNGTVNNSGQVELRTYRGGPDGTMPIFTLGDGADYQGKGQIWVRSYQENPVQYLVGFDGNKLSMINRDDMGGQFLYVDLNAVFEAFREACDLENHPDYYDLNDLGEFTILDDLTIPAGMQVDAWGTTLVIPDGVTLNVAGGLGCEALDVKEGGTVHAEGTGDFAWANVDVNEITCAGSSEVGDWSNFNINIYGWNETVANHLVVSDNGNVWINVPINNETEFQEGLLAAESFNTYSASIQGMNMNINYPCVLPDGFRINGQFMYHVHDNEYSHGSLTVPEGAMVTMTADSFVFMHGSSFIVSGTIENNGMIELCEAEYGGGDTGRLVIAEGGNYTGNGIVEVNASESPKSYITGIDQRRILTAWEDADNSWYAYRITETVPTVIADGSTFSFTTSDEGIFQNQYSCGILVTPQEDGLYSFTLSFANDPKIHWDEAWLGINGTDLQDQSFDTDEPASLVFSAMMYSGEGYELVFSNLAKLNAVTVNVSVSKASDGFTERLNAMAANPYQRFHVAIAAEDLTGLTALNVPINVTLDVDGELTIPSGLTVSCYGDFSVNQGGALHIPEGAMLNLIPDADWRTYGCVILDGGTLDAAANTMSFEGRACVQLQNRNYLSNEAALNAVSGVAISDITLEVEILSQSDYEYWYNVKASGYKDANLILLNGFHLTLSSDLPEGYCLVVNEGATVTVPDGTDAVLYGYIAMEGGGFTNNGLLTVDETAGINIWADGSQVTNNGTINLNGSIQSGNAFALTNNGDFTVMNAQAIPAKITFSPSLYHYPNEHRLVLPASLTSIETEAFANTAAWEVDLPDGIGSIGDGAFANADDLFLVVIPNGNASITGNPFQGSGNVIIAAPSGDSVNQFADGEQIPFIALAPQTQG